MILLGNRGIIEISGTDVCGFLNNILTNNIDNATSENAIYAALLSPQGKFLFDIFIIKTSENCFLLDCNDVDELFAKLRIYKLRSQINITNKSNELAVYYNDKKLDEYISFADCRHAELNYRIIAPKDLAIDADYINYEVLRISLNIPAPALDLIRDKDFALEALLDDMGAIDFHKGCYIGQEMTSRMKRRGTLKQKLQTFDFIGNAPEFDTPIIAEDTEIGRTRSFANGKLMALVRLDRLELAKQKRIKLLAGETQVIYEQEL
jgi:tRNA-modifying protein YgfZ